MSHGVIIIRRNASSPEMLESSYEYSIPIPHEATPHEVGELVRKAYKRLESSDD